MMKRRIPTTTIHLQTEDLNAKLKVQTASTSQAITFLNWTDTLGRAETVDNLYANKRVHNRQPMRVLCTSRISRWLLFLIQTSSAFLREVPESTRSLEPAPRAGPSWPELSMLWSAIPVIYLKIQCWLFKAHKEEELQIVPLNFSCPWNEPKTVNFWRFSLENAPESETNDYVTLLLACNEVETEISGSKIHRMHDCRAFWLSAVEAIQHLTHPKHHASVRSHLLHTHTALIHR